MLQTFFNENGIEAGCDEAGRGCLAGPVYAAAVIWPKELVPPPFIKDSKLLSEEQREKACLYIKENAIAYGIASVSHEEIDEINILNASFLAMHRAVDLLNESPTRLLIDGKRFNPYKNIAYECIIKGDNKFASIAAASILAKTARDQYMKALAQQFPNYGWLTNKGYPTKAHREAIRQYGSTPHHRKSFKLV